MADMVPVHARRVLAMAAAAAAGYHLLQLLKCLYLGRRFAVSPACCRNSRVLAWTCLLLDKVTLNNSLHMLYSISSERKAFIPPFE